MTGATSAVDVREGRTADVGPVADTLAHAFEADPVFAWLLPDERGRRRRLRRFFAIEVGELAIPHGTAWTTADGAGAALVMPPGHWQLPPSVMLSRGRGFLAAFGLRLPRATAMLTLLERKHIRKPHYYIPAIGVRPEFQGRGLGTALLRPTLERCDSEGLPAYLEASSEGSARLYRRLGFRDLEESRFTGSPPIWLMERAPA